MTNRTVLVTGSTGLLGKGLEETLPAGWTIVGVHQRDYAVTGGSVRHHTLDLRDKRAVDDLFAKHSFSAVIHAAGIANVDFVEKNYAESLESNIVSTLNVTAACRRAGIHLVYVSTNAVFDGTNAPYREDAAINPVNKYGRLKVECERLVQETLSLWTIARPILMYGWNNAQTRQNPVSWIHEKLSKREPVSLVTDVHENPLFNQQCARALWAILEKRSSGIFHLAGRDRVSRHELGLAIAEAFGLDGSLLKPVDSSAFPALARRPPDTTFIVSRMEKELGVPALSLKEGLAAMRAALTTGR